MSSARLQNIRSMYKNQSHFYKLTVNKIKETIPFTVKSKKIKYLEKCNKSTKSVIINPYRKKSKEI